MKTSKERQAAYDQRQAEKGFKKRAFYLNDQQIEKLKKIQQCNDFDTLHQALQDIIEKAPI